jgi:UDP-N-acetylglucosamine 1-carboxyvinyltransferase
MDLFQIEGARPLRGSVRISGSKNGCLPLIAAAMLGEDVTVIHNVPDLRDIREMVRLVQHLGARIDFRDGVMRVDPSGFTVDEVPYEIMVRMRASFYAMGPLLGRLGRAKVSTPGGCAIGARPVDLHMRGFAALGVQYTERFGFTHARHNGLKGARFSLLGPNGTSVGATCNVLMAAALAKGTTVIDDVAREPEVIELGHFLNSMGAKVEGLGTGTLRIEGVKKLKGTNWSVSPDRIEAATYAVAGLITHGDITLVGVDEEAMRPTLLALDMWGAELEWTGERDLHVRRGKSRKRPLQLITEPFPGFPTDAQPQVTALLAMTPGVSTVRETIYPERFMHVAELRRLGAQISPPDKGRIEISGVPALEGAAVMASDLRAGAALIVAALAAHGTSQVRRIYHVERGYEDIVNKLKNLGARIERLPDDAPAPGLSKEAFTPESQEEIRTVAS